MRGELAHQWDVVREVPEGGSKIGSMVSGQDATSDSGAAYLCRSVSRESPTHPTVTSLLT